MSNLPADTTSIKGPVPFWFVNGDIGQKDVAAEFEAMRAKGIREVLVHARYGITFDYLSDDWFRFFGWCVEEAKARDMRLWIYDELNWPSGTAGMSVQTQDPAYMDKYLKIEASHREDIDLTFFEPGQFLIAGRLQGGRITKTKLLPDLHSLRALDGSWHIFNCHIKRDPFYIDTLSRAAVDTFKHRTHEQYRREFGEEFGKTIRAVFTDEPAIYWVSVGHEDWTIPYTEKLFQSFEERYHYSAVPNIPYLFFPGHNAFSFRADFWEHVASLFNTNYHGNLGGWCRQNRLVYTGHNVYEEPLRYQIRFQGDMFGAMKQMDIPGVDHLGKRTLGNELISIIGHKIASSHAHAAGKPRVMSESFGLTGWDTTFLDLKKIVDWQFAHGVNLLVPHALFHTISGARKRGAPPTFFIQSPLWQDFDAFSAYVDRLSEALTGGKHLCRILILYPLSGLFAAYQPDRKTQEFECIDSFLNSLCQELMKRQLDYDLIDYTTLASAKAEEGHVRLGEESYDVLLVPYTPYMRTEEYETVGRIAKNVETYFFYRSLESASSNVPSQSNSVQFVPTEDVAGFVMRLRHAIDDGIHLTGQGREDILLLQREKDGKRIAFLVNRSEHNRKMGVRLDGNVEITVIEPQTGTVQAVSSRSDANRTLVSLRLAPYQSLILVAGDSSAPAQPVPEVDPEEIELDELAVETEENVALLFRFGYAEGEKRVDVRKNPRMIPTNWEAPAENYDELAGTYEAEIIVQGKHESIRMVLDSDFADCSVHLNDEEVILRPANKWLTDMFDVETDVTNLIREGANTIRVLSPTKLSEPIRFVGDFDVSASDGVVTISPRGKRNPLRLEESMPFYSGTTTYTTGFDLAKKPKSVELNLGDVRDSAAVYLNGKLAGKRLWPPYSIDITDFVAVGRNELRIEVRNNLSNLILGEPRAFGLRAKPKLEIIR